VGATFKERVVVAFVIGAAALETTLGPPAAFSVLADDGEELYATRKTAAAAINVGLIIVSLLST
jgi:hypothetical protein